MNNRIDPQLFSLSAILVGYILIGDYSSAELNAIGNWLMLAGQYIETYSAQQAVIHSKQNNNHNQQKNKECIYNLEIIESALKKMQQEINELKRKGDL